MEKRIGIIGAGNMATAFVKGLYNHHISGHLISVYDLDPEKPKKLAEQYDIYACEDLEMMFEKTNMIIIAVKPQNFKELSKTIKPYIKDQIIVSIMAGLEMYKIMDLLGSNTKLIRVMPNTPAMVNEGISGAVLGANICVEEQELFETVFEHFGMIVYIDETQFDAYTAICGSSPAFIYMFIQGMIEGGINEGLNPDAVPQMVAQAVIGAATMIRETGLDPVTLRENVTSKGGVTWKGVEFLQNAGLVDIVTKTIQETTARSVELNKEME